MRWLTGKRSPEENWDAFEAPTGRPFLELAKNPQPWSEVRYWLHDLAAEISAAEKDGTLPELALDRVWITGEGRAKLLDFPAPGLAPSINSQPSPINSFLSAVAATALTGSVAASAQAAGDVATPLPLHARAFLKGLPQLAGADAVALALKPLLSRVAAVSRLRRAAVVGGCLFFPVLASVGGLFTMRFMQQFTQRNPDVMELSTLTAMRTGGRFWGGKLMQLPADRQFAIYIAHHYRGLITNTASWESPMVLSMIRGEARKFAEQSVAEHPAPTPEEIKQADAALKKLVPKQQPFAEKPPPWMPAMTMVLSLFIYVCIPALIATLLFRGGLVLLIAGVTFVRNDGQRASRLRLLWRAIVAWSPTFLAFFVSSLALSQASGLGALAGPGVARPAGRVVCCLTGSRPAGSPGRHLAGAALRPSRRKANSRQITDECDQSLP